MQASTAAEDACIRASHAEKRGAGQHPSISANSLLSVRGRRLEPSSLAFIK